MAGENRGTEGQSRAKVTARKEQSRGLNLYMSLPEAKLFLLEMTVSHRGVGAGKRKASAMFGE